MPPLAALALMLENRVRRNQRRLAAPFARRNIEAYRLYDRDIPEIRAVVDRYGSHLVVAEYARTQTRAEPGWLAAMGEAAARGASLPLANVHLKERRTRPREGERYSRRTGRGRRMEVREGELRFWVNLDDRIDTGLFADHRETRALLRAESEGARFLNLFGYTGSFTCAAALGGATATTTVDASAAYLAWAEDNLSLNGLSDGRHRMVRAEVRAFLALAARGHERFSLCLLDPPSFSTRRGGSLDVQRDHPMLIAQALAVLEPQGVLYFSTNHQRFEPRLDDIACADLREITAETVPIDYRNRTAHRCFRLVR